MSVYNNSCSQRALSFVRSSAEAALKAGKNHPLETLAITVTGIVGAFFGATAALIPVAAYTYFVGWPKIAQMRARYQENQYYERVDKELDNAIKLLESDEAPSSIEMKEKVDAAAEIGCGISREEFLALWNTESKEMRRIIPAIKIELRKTNVDNQVKKEARIARLREILKDANRPKVEEKREQQVQRADRPSGSLVVKNGIIATRQPSNNNTPHVETDEEKLKRLVRVLFSNDSSHAAASTTSSVSASAPAQAPKRRGGVHTIFDDPNS